MGAGVTAEGSDRLLLDLWDRAGAAPMAARPAVLLDGLRRLAGLPADPPADGLPIGRRDQALMQLRAQILGPHVALQADCPDCGETFELSLDLAQLVAHDDAAAPASLQIGSEQVPLRPPSTGDLMAVLALPAPAQAEALLVRCALAPLPCPLAPAEIEAGARALALADPFADIQLSTTCPACGAGQTLGFDIAQSLWGDLSRLARRLLREVHHLASCHGWTEAEILSIPPPRRREYILMAGGQ